ncbi:MAG TPA: NAD(P)/FAD-dependent oxidoreductase [Solirubrobacterales bacterium]|jgi:cation diffusion facilitator CzcD-associated flavoprotein CzcO|nr:NAD(P)/FAD-dependent oxidoreductase [Solirubrobacterales bacterium]
MSGRLSVAIVGGGFGGVGAAAMLRREGYEDITVFEKAERLGGVWHHNTYPGAACDVPSHLYEFSFAPNRWSRRYAPQAEIQAYLEGVARHFGVADEVRTGVEVKSARWDEGRGSWMLETSAGPHEAAVLITACGQLSVPKKPALPGLESFEGPAFHTAEWRHDVDLAGKRVAVIGTGCSAIQAVPAIQPIVEQIDVYQRSAGWTIPRMDYAYPDWAHALFKRLPAVRRLDRAATFAFMELGAAAMTRHGRLLAAFRAAGRRQVRSAISDPELRRKAEPTDEVGCKRIMVTDDWYPALARPNVELVTESIEAVTAAGVRDAAGVERPADALILATGFATHGFVAPMEVVGADGRSLGEEWGDVPRAYLGLTVPGFPNMFLLYGPNTNGGTGSVIHTIECGIGHVLAALREMERVEASRIEVRREAAESFDGELRAALAGTVWHSGCTNWYVDENGNDPSQWPWLWSTYKRRTARLDPGAYELSGAREMVASRPLG